MKFAVTVGLSTCYGGESLLATVNSIRKSKDGESIDITIEADRTPIKENVMSGLKKLGAKVHWNSVEGSQFKKVKQMVDACKSDIYISTQDDVIFDKDTVKEITRAFQEDPKLTMVGIRIFPLPPVTFFESAMASMLRIVDSIAQKWNKGDNHLSSSGRCLAFRATHIKKFRIPQTIVNGDMFFYLENKHLGGKFKLLKNAKVFIRCPQHLKDQVAPSSRYLYSKEEMKNYFEASLEDEYKIPHLAILPALVEELAIRPVSTVTYLMIRVYTFIFRQPKKVVANPVWKVDASTKST